MWNWKSSFLQPLGPCFCDRLSRVWPGGHKRGGAEDGDGVGMDQVDVSAFSCTASGAKTRSDKEQRGVVAVPGCCRLSRSQSENSDTVLLEKIDVKLLLGSQVPFSRRFSAFCWFCKRKERQLLS